MNIPIPRQYVKARVRNLGKIAEPVTLSESPGRLVLPRNAGLSTATEGAKTDDIVRYTEIFALFYGVIHLGLFGHVTMVTGDTVTELP
jgi:hypothetical protein